MTDKRRKVIIANVTSWSPPYRVAGAAQVEECLSMSWASSLIYLETQEDENREDRKLGWDETLQAHAKNEMLRWVGHPI
jgi:hypothetical protein